MAETDVPRFFAVTGWLGKRQRIEPGRLSGRRAVIMRDKKQTADDGCLAAGLLGTMPSSAKRMAVGVRDLTSLRSVAGSGRSSTNFFG